jgi:hypothetical protein
MTSVSIVIFSGMKSRYVQASFSAMCDIESSPVCTVVKALRWHSKQLSEDPFLSAGQIQGRRGAESWFLYSTTSKEQSHVVSHKVADMAR